MGVFYRLLIVLVFVFPLYSCVQSAQQYRQAPPNASFSGEGEKWAYIGEYSLLGEPGNSMSVEEKGNKLYMLSSWGNTIVGVRDGSKGRFSFQHGGKNAVTVNELSDDGKYMRGRMVVGASSYGEDQYLYYRRIGSPVLKSKSYVQNTVRQKRTEFVPAAVSDQSLYVPGKIKRTALVIGNGNYRVDPLRNSGRDAIDVASTLRELGFTVILKHDLSLKEMEAVVDAFHVELNKGAVGLFYYAGHGVQVDGRNYLVPTDASINSESDIKYECLDAGRVLGKMEDAGNGMNIVILDACRNNPFARSFRSGVRGLARMDAPTGSIVAYSTAPGSVAADGAGQNGVYTKHLLHHMKTPGLDISDIFLLTRKGVIGETKGKQVPWESSSLTDYFYFMGKNPAN